MNSTLIQKVERGHPVRQRAKYVQLHGENRFENIVRAAGPGGQDV